MSRRTDTFSTVKIEGAFLPPDLLQRMIQGDGSLKGLTPDAYHLAKRERINEAANRAWNRLLGAWSGFSAAMENLPESDSGTSLTRERWLLILFQELGYGRLRPQRAIEMEGRHYAISHLWDQTPIHLVSFRRPLDRRSTGVRGAARVSPHSLIQEFLNRSDDYLWGFASNGLSLRILRDNVSLSRAAYIEFDLQAMMEGEVYSDFVLFWMLAHQSRIEVPEGERPEQCWLERWYQTAVEEGSRVLDHLRDGVEQAIEALGTGFLRHPKNETLRERIAAGNGAVEDYYHQILRMVYRLLFLFVAEDRELLLMPGTAAAIQEIYREHYSTKRLRRLADRIRGSNHADLYQGLKEVLTRLHDACGELGLPALGGFLFSPDAIRDLETADIGNRDLLDAIRHLSYMEDGHGRRPIDYRNLGAEELGSVYESLLEQHPTVNGGHIFRLDIAAGSDRKTTGSYYTPTELIRCLLDSALDPVADDAVAKKDAAAAEQALLDLKICDPACGSGHFLVAAAQRLAKRLAAVRTDEEEPSAEARRSAIRDVIGRCIYGVDINPMTVELCKINLWMEALEPGKTLTFLDHHIQCGNSLLGATPALMADGIPDDAFKPIQGDDKKICAALKKQNKVERHGQQSLFREAPPKGMRALSDTFSLLRDAADDSPGAHEKKRRLYQETVASAAYREKRLAADAWCAAFVWKKDGSAPGGALDGDAAGSSSAHGITSDLFRRIEADPERVARSVVNEIERLRERYQFFHWHLAFPEVFQVPEGSERPSNDKCGWSGGFDAVLGNPPWERIKLQEKEFFATRDPEVATAPNAAARGRLINKLIKTNPELSQAFQEAKREAEGASHIVRDSARYPLGGRGDVNTYAVFAELIRDLAGPAGRSGCIVPSGIATDDTTKFFFQDLMDKRSLVSLYDFENRNGIFQGVHRSYKFCLLTLAGSGRPAGEGAEFVFFAHQVSDLREENRRFTLSAEDLELLNPNTRTCPIFRTRRDAEITKGIYQRVPVLIREARDGRPEENPWGIRFATMFHMSNDSGLFRTRDELEGAGFKLKGNIFARGKERYLPLYEAKMIHHFNHRFGDYADLPEDSKSTQLPDVPLARLQDPNYAPMPRYWVAETEVEQRLAGKWDRGWLLGWRDICRSTDERTVIAGVVPRVGVGHTCPLLLIQLRHGGKVADLLANLSTFALDYAARQKIGGIHLTYNYLNQFPTLDPSDYDSKNRDTFIDLGEWVGSRSLEMIYVANELGHYAKEFNLDHPPFRYDPARRFLIRCELDAAYFHLYGINRDDVDYIMDTFPIVKRKDEKKHGEYRTKRVILEIYDEMAAAMKTGKPYKTRLDPPPGDPSLAHPPK
ncbi:MAG: SAM-dependent methyltransferase [Candidatus Eisenbacteria bacterium]|uniref:site-specific DNA-methyltransferase (adenine-specific) n=1 Tax=Eiseniibacteriota bacterium TaxID=2212470 RepID=A0A948RWM3_UNCEI|nr:SAM-dependent methyltransferase [Candidatus Eisenbacteria bacterium]MBU1949124.1 SAM-dependent methyltransferase [Candidatus Eisenbacteria bacterium]MBU2692390.1 SAM-dependent methyltransferase [Candidatus Eisenbacteria bacterium]